MASTMDAQLTELARGLAARFHARGWAGRRLEATIALAVEFSTWSRLKDRGFDDREAAELMADLAASVAGRRA
jgi:hypothetical protein